jgi:hypothetical protein
VIRVLHRNAHKLLNPVIDSNVGAIIRVPGKKFIFDRAQLSKVLVLNAGRKCVVNTDVAHLVVNSC